MSSVPTLRLAVESPLNSAATPQHLEQIAAARAMGRKVRRAVIAAQLSGWTTLLFGVLTLITSLTSLTGLILGMGMCIVSIVEFKGCTALKRLDRTAPRRLATNQIAFGFLLFSYAALGLWTSLHTPSSLTSDPQLQQMLGSIAELERTIYVIVYTTLMLVGLGGPGLMAWYYASRIKHIDNYVARTPKWILELQQAGMSL